MTPFSQFGHPTRGAIYGWIWDSPSPASLHWGLPTTPRTRSIWTTCQQEQLVLITGNRNDDGPDLVRGDNPRPESAGFLTRLHHLRPQSRVARSPLRGEGRRTSAREADRDRRLPRCGSNLRPLIIPWSRALGRWRKYSPRSWSNWASSALLPARLRPGLQPSAASSLRL